MFSCTTYNSHCAAVTNVSMKALYFTWKIHNFESLHPGENNCINVEGMVNNTKVWFISLYPDGNYNKDYISAKVKLSNFNLLKIKYSPYELIIYIINKNGKEEELYKCTIISSVKLLNGCDIETLIKKEDLFSYWRSKYLPKGNLTLKFKISYTDKVESKSISVNVLQANEPRLNSLEHLFNNEKFSDVKISVGDKVFHLHRGILANQSPVFLAMFSHDMKENQENLIRIEDIDCNVMEEVLRFIYIGEVNSEVSARELLAAAEKYGLEQLKIISEQRLIDQLNVNTVTDLLIFADKYGATMLMEYAINFFHFNSEEVTQTEEYKKCSDSLRPILQKKIVQ